MNKTLIRYREKYRRNAEKITELTEENKQLAPKIRDMENREIVGLVRGHNMTLDELEEKLGALPTENGSEENEEDESAENTAEDSTGEEKWNAAFY